MTVIAYKDGVMAADTGVTSFDLLAGQQSKLFRLGNGWIVGAAGWQPVIDRAVSWLAAGAPADARPRDAEDDSDLDCLVFRGGEGWRLFGKHFDFYRLTEGPNCAGSHGEFLMGAMLAGASAVEAVELALRYGKHASGEVDWLRVTA